MKYALALLGLLVLAGCAQIDSGSDDVLAACEPYVGSDVCTEQYDPVCATLADGSEVTMSNECFACISGEDVVDIVAGECETDKPVPNDTGLPEPDPVTAPPVDLSFSACAGERPEGCAAVYDPVCASVDTGIRCVTTPCPSQTFQTRGNACSACADEDVSGYYDGACEDLRFVLCDQETVTGFDPAEYAEDIGAVCVAECPEGFDSFTTQIGVSECIAHYGEQEIAAWPTCTESSDACNCVLARETTDGGTVDDAEFRCMPDLYAERMLFTGGQTRLDESGDESTVIA